MELSIARDEKLKTGHPHHSVKTAERRMTK